MWFLRINMSDRTHQLTEVPEKFKKLAGRALTSNLIADEVPPQAHPLGANNKLVFSPGFVTGTTAPTSSRISVGGKSPLTGGIKESNAGSRWAQKIAKMGIKALIVEGQPEEKEKFWGVLIHWDEAAQQPKLEWFDANEYVGQDLYEIYPKVFENFEDRRVSICSIGTASEHGYGNAGVVFDDMSKRPSRYAGRGGLGSVMGSKGLKFILMDDKGAPGVEIADKELFEIGRKKMVAALREHAITKPKGALNTYGTAVLINILNEAGGLPTRNFSGGRFESAAKIAGEAIFEGNKERLGKELYNHACSPGCIIRCSNTWYNEDKSEHVSCIEYESDWAFGANLGIDDLDVIGELVKLCNGYGLDTIETGVTLGVAMEAGVLPFGDGESAIEMVHQMGKGEPMGRILGSGTGSAGKVLGVTRVPAVKGQGMPAYEPRAVKGIGITYATSTMGADHTSGYTICPEILGVSGSLDPLSPEGKAALSRAFQATTAFIDSSGHCLFIAFAILDIASGYEGMIEEVNGVLGTNWTADEIVAYGADVLKIERKFNEAAGIGKAQDRLPEFMHVEPLPPHDVVFDVDEKALDSVYGDL